MPIGCFTDKDKTPTARQIARALGARRALWNGLNQYIANTYAMEGELNFGGKNYGWNVRYRRGGRTLTSLFPQNDHFIALVVIGPSELEAVRALPLGPKVRAVLERATAYPEGRWLYVPVKTKRDAGDVQRLLSVKRKPPAKPAVKRATTSVQADFDDVAHQLTTILSRYAKGSLAAKADARSGYSLTGPANEVSQGREVWFGAVRKGKAYVSYHLMPVYACPDLLDDLSPELKKHMQGKSCFNFKRADPALFKELAALTRHGYQRFRKAKLIG